MTKRIKDIRNSQVKIHKFKVTTSYYASECMEWYNSFLTLLIAFVRLTEAVYVVVEILHRLWSCVPAFSHVGYIATPFLFIHYTDMAAVSALIR